MTDVIGFAFGAIVAIGGVMGYMKAGSLMSLCSGILFGALASYGASKTSRDPSDCLVILGTAVTLAGVMGYRFMGSGKFMPAGLVAVLSLLMVIRYGMRYM